MKVRRMEACEESWDEESAEGFIIPNGLLLAATGARSFHGEISWISRCMLQKRIRGHSAQC